MIKWLKRLFCRHKKYSYSKITIDGERILKLEGIDAQYLEPYIMCAKCGKVFK